MARTYLESKPRYEILDGLRGIAAMIVVGYHIFQTYAGGPIHQIINHGYLAVDFFFVLSGFVIGYAYDDRWSEMTLWDFAKRRLVRLHPMVILSTAIGVALFYYSAGPSFPGIAQVPWWRLLFVAVLSCLMIPTPPSYDIRGWGDTNAFNGPMWSLSFEYVGNILYALFIRHFSRIALTVFVALSAFLTIDLTMNLDVFGLLKDRTAAAYTVIGGWLLTPEQVYIGFTRLLYPFFAGLLLSRLGWKIKVNDGFWWTSLMVAAILVMPRVGGTEHMWMNGLYEVIVILFVFPLIVSMGAGSQVKGKRTAAICDFLGRISYPLYLTHHLLIYFQYSWAVANSEAPLSTHVFVGVATFLISIAIAYASMKLYDEPARQWLKDKVLAKKSPKRQ